MVAFKSGPITSDRLVKVVKNPMKILLRNDRLKLGTNIRMRAYVVKELLIYLALSSKTVFNLFFK